MNKLYNALRSISAVSQRLNKMRDRVAYVSPQSDLCRDLESEAIELSYQIEVAQELLDQELQTQLNDARNTVGGVLKDLLNKSN